MEGGDWTRRHEINEILSDLDDYDDEQKKENIKHYLCRWGLNDDNRNNYLAVIEFLKKLSEGRFNVVVNIIKQILK